MSSTKKRVKQLISAFDLDFSDIYPNESARANTFRHKFSDLAHVADIVECDSIINYNLFEKLPEGHPSSELWLETQTDLTSSIYLTLGGYYRQAIACLRGWLEIVCVGIYYGRHYKGPNSRYNQWKNGRRKSPYWKNLLHSLFNRPNFQKANTLTGLRQSMKDLHDELCMFVHNQAMNVYKLQKGRDNVPRYLSRSFDIWHKLLIQTFNLILLILSTAYPKETKAISRKDLEKILAVVSSNTSKKTQNLLIIL